MDIEKKLEEAIQYHNTINQQIQEGEAQLSQLRDAKQQLVGRIQTYREIVEDEKQVAAENVVDVPSKP